MQQPGVLVVGGGAAGLCAAIAAARGGAAVTVLEAGPRVGRKILASGNGRCNLSNTAIAPDAYNEPRFVAPVLAEFSCDSVRAFFGELGLLIYADEEGRIYPVTNTASSVLDVLRLECERLGVEVRVETEVVSVVPETGPRSFILTAEDGSRALARAVVVTPGGGSTLLASLGHEQVAFSPVLVPLRTDTAPIRGLSGVRVRCAASLLAADGDTLATERGELLFREYGVSGIMVFDLSRHLAGAETLAIDLFPDLGHGELHALLEARCEALAWRSAGTFFDGMLHPRIALAVLRAAGLDPEAQLDAARCADLADLLKGFRIALVGPGDAKQAQVTRGGAVVEQFDPPTMASRLVPGLFAAGEALDVDGRCGGYNLHWAWASGIIAGRSAARFATDAAPDAAEPNASAGDPA